MFDYKAIQDDCLKCGKCIPVCTIHQVNADEVTSPRGFIDLLGAYSQGELGLDKNAKNIFESCFLCTNCVDVCPNRLQTDMIIENVRRDIADKFGLAWFKRFYFYLLRNRKTMDFLFSMGYIFVPCAMKNLDGKQSMQPRFSMPLVKKRVFPRLNFKSFLSKHTEIENPNQERKVAIFIGCFANYHYTQIGESLLKILKELNITSKIAKKQLCCGAPAYFTGDFDTVSYLVKKNIEYFETFIDEVEAIIIPEATCSAMIKADWEHFLENEKEVEWLERAKKLMPKVFMATEWLEKKTNLKEVLRAKNVKFDELITYHDPCHARKVQGVFKEPRALISQNYAMVEMEDPNRCCGFGGVTMQTEKFSYALAAGEPKATMIKATKAHTVSAECSACRMQLTNALEHYGVDTKFAHPLELIAKAL